METPLVSVIVATYNSEKTIINTLESVKNQTYENIELIVSDDCSTDTTICLVNQWLGKNKDRFTSVILVEARENTGVTGNCIRGIEKSKGIYIKLLGADDRLLEACIAMNVDYMQSHPYEIVMSRYAYKGSRKLSIELENSLKRYYKLLLDGNQKELRYKLVEKFSLPTTTCFFTRKLYDRVGGFDNRLPFWEDYPFFYKLLYKEIPFGFFDEETYEYNLQDDSLSHAVSKIVDISYVSYMHLKDQVKFFFLYELKILLKYKFYNRLVIRACSLLPKFIKIFCYKLNKIKVSNLA